jgi:hypothetical protein
MSITCIVILFAALFPAKRVEADPTAPQSRPWDVSAHHGPGREVLIDTREGTWMSLDVSPDRREIAFDLLGDPSRSTAARRAR